MAPSYMTDIISFSKNDHYSLRSVKHEDLVLKKKPKTQCFKDSVSFWVASTDATHIFVWNWGSKMAAFPVMVPDFFVL